MELVIVHEHGWSCTNTANKGSKLQPIDGGKLLEYKTVIANQVFDVVGVLQKEIEAIFIFPNYEGWVCEVTSINNNEVRATRKSVIDQDKVKQTLNQIKQHHGTTR